MSLMLSNLWEGLFYFWFAAEIAIAFATRSTQSSAKLRDRGSQLVLWIVILVCLTACEWLRHILQPNILGGAHWVRSVGIILLAVGLVIRCVAILTLGRAFSANVAIRKSQKIKRTGLYRFVRHPSYLGLVIIFLAIGVHSRNWECLAIAFLPTTAALLYRIRIEEAALREAFGDEYADYGRTTRRLIPRVY
jgi:protein-S-isoprenylcysteine O-methyltransferase Ste14